MNKVYPHINQGPGYIQLSKLPFNQGMKLKNWLSRNSLIKVRIGTLVIEDCIQFSEYEYWFDLFYQRSGREAEFEI